MSSYLGFKKNGTVLCWFCRSSKIYEALSEHAPFDEWSEVKPSHILAGQEALKEDKKALEDSINIRKEMIKHNLKYEDLFETISTIKNLEDEIKEIDAADAQLGLLLQIIEDGNYDEKKPITEWSIG